MIFAGGVLVVLQLAGTLSRQMDWAATTSEIVVLAQQRLDSLETVAFSSLATGTLTEALTVRGKSYTLETTVTTLTALLKQVDVSVEPGSGVDGPSYSTTSYSADAW